MKILDRNEQILGWLVDRLVGWISSISTLVGYLMSNPIYIYIYIYIYFL